MKLTESRVRQIIQEELLRESLDISGVPRRTVQDIINEVPEENEDGNLDQVSQILSLPTDQIVVISTEDEDSGKAYSSCLNIFSYWTVEERKIPNRSGAASLVQIEISDDDEGTEGSPTTTQGQIFMENLWGAGFLYMDINFAKYLDYNYDLSDPEGVVI